MQEPTAAGGVARVNGDLAVSRGFGDAELKKPGVTQWCLAFYMVVCPGPFYSGLSLFSAEGSPRSSNVTILYKRTTSSL